MTLRSFGFQPPESVFLCGLAALNPVLLAAGTSVGPDLACAALLLVVFALLGRSESGAVRPAILAGVLTGAAYLLRTAVLPLLATAPLYLLWRRRGRGALLFLASSAPFVAAWSYWARAHMPATRDPTTVFYTNYLGDLLLHFSWRRAPVQAVENVGSLFEYAGMSSVFLAALALPAVWGLLFLVGVALLARRTGLTQFHVFALGYLVMLVVWPYKPLLRYLLPMLPLVLAGFAYLLSQLTGFLLPAGSRLAALSALAVIACGSAVLGFSAYRADLRRYESESPGERAAYAWMRANLPPDAKLVAANPGVLYLYTGRQAAAYEPLKDFYLTPDEIAGWRRRLPGWAEERGIGYAFCDARLCAGALAERETPLARAVLEESGPALFRAGPVAVYRLAP
ncbi:MAG: hypothetical protein IT159_02690 [Bryobacterales bacterium]|nr:hypothetical protein [Bryobacterales bacterium]